jgi:hypothetical protein
VSRGIVCPVSAPSCEFIDVQPIIIYIVSMAGINGQKMELKQTKGKCWDRLKIEGDRIHHEWDLGRESGSRSTALANIDPHVGQQLKKTEGKWPYLVIATALAGLMLWATQGDGVNAMFWGILPTFFVVCLVIASRIRSQDELSLVYLRDGSVFAVVRHDWVSDEAREAFLIELSMRK